MRSLLGVDSIVYRVLTRWYELVLLSLGWLVLSLPVITLPVATDWLVDGVRRTGRGEPIRSPGATWAFVRARFTISTRLGLVHLLVLSLLLIGAFGPSPGGAAGSLVGGVVVLVGVTWALVAPWSVVLIDQRGLRSALRTAYVRALRHLSLSFLSGVIVAAGVALVVVVPAAVRLPVLIGLPGIVAALVITLCDRAAPDAAATTAPPTLHRLPVRLPVRRPVR